MTSDAKQIMAKLRGEETERGRVSLYLSKDLYARLKKACGPVPVSRAVEEMITRFLEELEEKKPTKK